MLFFLKKKLWLQFLILILCVFNHNIKNRMKRGGGFSSPGNQLECQRPEHHILHSPTNSKPPVLNIWLLTLKTVVVQWRRIHLPVQETQRIGFDPRVGKIPWRRK